MLLANSTAFGPRSGSHYKGVASCISDRRSKTPKTVSGHAVLERRRGLVVQVFVEGRKARAGDQLNVSMCTQNRCRGLGAIVTARARKERVIRNTPRLLF